MKKLQFYYIYDKFTGEVYHTYLNKQSMRQQKLRAKLLGISVRIGKHKLTNTQLLTIGR